jgi:hypothetical protein
MTFSVKVAILGFALLFSVNGSADSKIECSSIYAKDSRGWVPKEFSFTLSNGRVSSIWSDAYKYKKTQLKVIAAHDSKIKIQYNGIHKTTKGQSIGTIHVIEIRPEEKRIWYTVSMNGYSNFYRGRGTCTRKRINDSASNSSLKKSAAAARPTCPSSIRICTATVICARGTTKQRGSLHWESSKSSAFYRYFVEAKRRGLKCDGATIFNPSKPDTSTKINATERTKLAVAKLHGYGIKKDIKSAMELFLLSAKQGDSSAQNWLGQMYRDGSGTVKNYKKSYMWFNIAKANGYSTAGRSRDLVGKSMSASAISAAQDKSSSCFESGYVDCSYTSPPVKTSSQEKVFVSAQAPDKGRLQITFSDDSWVDVKDGEGRLLVSDLFSKGDTVDKVVKTPIEVLLGAVSGVALVKFDGRVIKLGVYTRRNIARFTLESQD